MDTENKSVAHIENWLRGLPTVERESVIGEIQARENLAARGRLLKDNPSVLKPVSSYKRMWEMRWTIHAAGNDKRREIRQYHAEPESDAKALVRLHRHIKRVNVPALVWRRQQAEMAFAKRRFEFWPGVESVTP